MSFTSGARGLFCSFIRFASMHRAVTPAKKGKRSSLACAKEARRKTVLLQKCQFQDGVSGVPVQTIGAPRRRTIIAEESAVPHRLGGFPLSPSSARYLRNAALFLFLILTSLRGVRADIYRWDNGQLIPGTEGITPGPGVRLDGWNTETHNLRYADFSGGLDLTEADFHESWLDGVDFSAANLALAGLYSSTLSDANLAGANLTHANVSRTTLTNADLSGANLTGVALFYSTLTGADLKGSNLTGADLYDSTLTNADLTGAIIAGTQLHNTTSRGFSDTQLYSTASYQRRSLKGIWLGRNDLTGWDFSEQDLTNAYLSRSILTAADLTGSIVTGANFGETTSRGFTREQLYVTASYSAKKLQGIDLGDNDLTGWDLSEQNLTCADLTSSIMTDANLAGANLTNATLRLSTLTNTDLTGANLKNTDLHGVADLETAKSGATTTYNQWTIFPGGFDPEAAGLTLSASARGDFNSNGVLDATDIDLLTTKKMRRFVSWLSWLDHMFDLDSNSWVEEEDRRIWIKDLKHTWYGDADLNGEFNSSDIVQVFRFGKYETSVESKWSEGDWNGDGIFDTGDLVIALQDGGYEQGPRPIAVVVPEPNSVLLLMAGLIGVALGGRRLRSGTAPRTRTFRESLQLTTDGGIPSVKPLASLRQGIDKCPGIVRQDFLGLDLRPTSSGIATAPFCTVCCTSMKDRDSTSRDLAWSALGDNLSRMRRPSCQADMCT